MIPWSYCWNNIRLRPLRILLTVLSIAGGVAAVVAVLQATAATRDQLAGLHETMSSRSSMEIVAADASAFSLQDASPLSEVPGVEAAVPVHRVFALIYSGRQHVRGIATGVDLEQYRHLRDFDLVAGRLCSGPDEACIEAGAAEHLGVLIGQDVNLRVRGKRWLTPKTITGIIRPRGLGTVEETASLFMPLSAAGQLNDADGSATSIKIVLGAGASADSTADQVQKRLPGHLRLERASSSASLSGPTQAIVNVALNVAACLSIVAAIFIVINTFQISVAERQRQMALLRVVGATTGQVRGSIYQEACLLGGVGTVLGVVLGIAGSRLVAQGVQSVFGLTETARFEVRTHAVLAGLFFGPLVTFLSVWFPARTACDAPPLQVLKSATAPKRSRSRFGAIRWGVALLLVMVAMFVGASRGLFPEKTAIAGILCLLIACTICLPALIGPGTRLLTRGIGSLFPIESQISQSQLLDNFGRTALTIMVMFVVSATCIGIGSTTLSVTADVEGWLDRTLTADFLIRASRPRVDMPEADSLPDDVDGLISSIPGIESIDRMSFSLATIEGRPATLLTRQTSGYETMPIDLLEGDPAGLRDRLLAGEAVLGAVLANRIGCHTGDQVRIEISGIGCSIAVAGIAREYTSGGLMIIMDQAAGQARFPIRASQVYGIRTASSATESVGQTLRQIAQERGLIFQSLSDLRNLVRRMISGLTSRLWIILCLALIIACFAIVNTLTMSVIQQTRQLGLLRVVGMTQRQVVGMFLIQSLVLGCIALVPGTALGVLMGYLITICFRGVADQGVAFVINPAPLSIFLVTGILLSLLAGLLPAIRAVRLKPLEAIHEE
jgi:putative ABC transport system permease protein